MNAREPTNLDVPVVDAVSGVDLLLSDLHTGIIDVIRSTLLFLGFPFGVILLMRGLYLGTVSVWLMAEIATIWGSALLLSLSTVSLKSRKLLMTALINVMAAATLLNVGPILSVGMLFVASVFLGSLFFGIRGSLISFGFLLLAQLGWTVGTFYGVVNSEYTLSTLQEWARLGFSANVTLIAIGLLFDRIHRSLQGAIEQQLLLRERERRQEQKRERVIKTAYAAQRLESLGRLAGGIAHDFNNSLVVIKGGVELLSIVKDPDDRAAILEDIEHGVERAADTARQLLAFARADVEETGDSLPAVAINNLVNSIRRLFPETIQLRVETEPTPSIPLSAAQLEQALLNLALNAKDAMPNGGTITFKAHHDVETNDVVIEVRDDGVGMPKNVMDQVFEPFFTTKKDGTGLGLAMVWGVFVRQGGDVTVQSSPGVGTRFLLRAPSITPMPEAKEPVELPQTLSGRLLVLEDEDSVRVTIERILGHAGLDVVAVATADAAQTELADSKFDLLLTDAIVPGGGVGELIETYLKNQPNHPVIICSGYLEDDLLLEGIRKGSYEFVGKPFATMALLQVVSRLLASKPD